MARADAGRRTVALALLASLAGGVGAAVSVACGSFGEELPATQAPDGGGVVAPVAEGGAVGDGGVCDPGAFCDSFDDGEPLPRRWRAAIMLGAATLKVVQGEGVGGSSALVATLANDGTTQNAYLTLDVPNGGASYGVVLAFSARVTTSDKGFVLGPRFFGDTANSGARHVIVDWHDNMIRLDQYIPACDGGCQVSNIDTQVDQSWHRYVLTLDVHGAGASDRGALKLELDGVVLVAESLPFSLSSPSKSGLQFGASYSGGNAGGTIAFDDVSVLVTPR